MTQASIGARARRPQPTRSVAVRKPARRVALSASVTSAFRALVAGVVAVEVIVLVLWAADTSSGATASQAARAGLVAWAWVHHATIHLPNGIVGFTPPGLLALPLWLTRRAARHLHDPSPAGLADGLTATAMIAVPYALLAVGTATAATTQGIHADLVTTGFGAGLLAAVGAGSWTLARPISVWWSARSVGLRAAARAGATALASLLAVGAAATGLSLVWHFSLALELSKAVTTSYVGGVGLLLLGVMLAPAAAVWGASVGVGPGFALGAHTSVTAGSVHLAGAPAVSLAAALPASGPAPLGLRVLPFAIAAVGIVAGWRMHRSASTVPLVARCGWMVLAGVVAGVGFAAVAALSGGPVAPGRLATVGPSAWHVGLAAAEEIAVVGALAVGALHWRASRKG